MAKTTNIFLQTAYKTLKYGIFFQLRKKLARIFRILDRGDFYPMGEACFC